MYSITSETQPGGDQENTMFIQASLCEIQGLLKDFHTVFKDLKLFKILIYTLKFYFRNATKDTSFRKLV